MPSFAKLTCIPARAVVTLSARLFKPSAMNLQLEPMLVNSDGAVAVDLLSSHPRPQTPAQLLNGPTARATVRECLILHRFELRGFGGSPFGGIGAPALWATSTSLGTSRNLLMARANSSLYRGGTALMLFTWARSA
jgi:hypothetical protein